ncbi:MAG: ATP-binding cassette domain-containing protein [Bacteriovoracaceae bacterium]|nr:ATP-binding cassette domain-containing protein [Bacteriovoracaceae bacterium]
MNKELAISVKDLTKKFGEHTILDSLNLDVEKGSITTILGFSGAGKSTLLKLFLGLLMPTTGSITTLGENITKLSGVRLREFRRHFGMLFQYAALFDYLSAFENVAFPLREFSDLTEKEITEKVHGLLESVGIVERAYYNLPSELSGGMRKRVGLARALALSPDIMLYDEPTTGLDPITTKMVNDLIVETSERHAENKMTSIIISHDVKASLAISDYVAFLHLGKVVEYLPAKDFPKSTNPLVQEFINL